MPVIIDEVELEPTEGRAVADEPPPRPRRPQRPDPTEVLALLRREETRRQRLRAD